jgi:hypothetical protein
VRSALGFSPKPKVFEGLDAVIGIAPLAIDLPLAEIYAGVQHQ